MGKSDANECNESSLSNCRVQLALSTKKDGMILEKLISAKGSLSLMPVCIASKFDNFKYVADIFEFAAKLMRR